MKAVDSNTGYPTISNNERNKELEQTKPFIPERLNISLSIPNQLQIITFPQT